MPGPRTKLYKYVCLITLDIKYEKVSQKRHRSILGKVDNGFGCRYNPALSSKSVDLLLGKPYKGYGTEESFDHTSESSFLNDQKFIPNTDGEQIPRTQKHFMA
jgi:hypothetical protein